MSNENKIRVLYVQPGKYPEERVIEHTLAAMQALVGGDIEAVYPWEDNACVVCDDEGKVKHKPLNRPLEDYDVLSGDFFVCGLGEDDFTSLTDEQMKRYEQLYHDPVVFVPSFMGNAVRAAPSRWRRYLAKNGYGKSSARAFSFCRSRSAWSSSCSIRTNLPPRRLPGSWGSPALQFGLTRRTLSIS